MEVGTLTILFRRINISCCLLCQINQVLGSTDCVIGHRIYSWSYFGHIVCVPLTLTRSTLGDRGDVYPVFAFKNFQSVRQFFFFFLSFQLHGHLGLDSRWERDCPVHWVFSSTHGFSLLDSSSYLTVLTIKTAYRQIPTKVLLLWWVGAAAVVVCASGGSHCSYRRPTSKGTCVAESLCS